MDKNDDLVDAKIEAGLKDVCFDDTSLNGAGKDAAESVERLYRMRTERIKVEAEIEARKKELEQKDAQLTIDLDKIAQQKADSKRNLIKDIAIGGGTLLLGVAKLISLRKFVKNGYEFEKTGTITSSTLRNSISQMFHLGK
ncbi:MAG: hypothetical protein J6T99_06230 [Oscillospiraceae bacterium]|nr:hypothetical protein [Oscillospiraceae bacterium]